MTDKNSTYLSVVMSVYNDGEHLGEAIESVLNQSYTYFEFIIINDGSTDNSEDVIKSFEDDRIVYIKKENSGLADSLNAGINIAKYDWIVRMDGDDICMQDRFKVLVENFTEEIDIIGSNAIYFNDSGDLFTSSMPGDKAEIINAIRNGKSAFIHPSVAIRKSLLLSVGGYDSNFRRAQDHNLWSRSISLIREAKNIKEPLLRYRFYAKSKANNYNAIMGTMMDNYIIFANISQPFTKEEYSSLRKKIEKTIAFRISYFLSNILYVPVLKYAYPIWVQLNISRNRMKRLAKEDKSES